MSALSDYLEAALLDHAFRGAPYSAPVAVHLALFTSDPLDDNSGTEVTGGGYARIVAAFDRTLNSITNNSVLSFTATGADFGTITHIGVMDAASGGNLMFRGALATAKTIEDGDTLTFAVGDIDLTLD